jgi:predicted phosphohydrolase
MKIQYASDLHLEFPDNKHFLKINPIIPMGNILLLGGDIVALHKINQYADFFKFCSDNFEKTYWIAGNHEYYHGNLRNRTGHFVEDITTNVHLVNNHSIKYGKVEIILSTLWTPISEDKAWDIERGVNDYRIIKDGEERFTALRSSELFQENLKFIKTSIENSKQTHRIVMTHHVPTFINYPKAYLNSSINEAFAVNLDSVIEPSNIDFWIYGHHHQNTEDFYIGNTKLITNQLGYVKFGEHKGFKRDSLLEFDN